jgi:hypothetical protein
MARGELLKKKEPFQKKERIMIALPPAIKNNKKQ